MSIKNSLHLILFLFFVVDSYAISDTLIYPNQPNVIFSAGSSYPIIWNACNLPDTTTINIKIRDLKSPVNSSYLLEQVTNTGSTIINLPSVINNFDSVQIEIVFPFIQRNNLIGKYSFKISSQFYDVYTGKEDSITITKKDSILLKQYKPEFLVEFKEWVLQPKFESTRIALNVTDTPFVTCFDQNTSSYDNTNIRVLKSGEYFFKRKKFDVLTLYSLDNYSCASFINSSSIKFLNSHPLLYITSHVPRFRLNAGDNYFLRTATLLNNLLTNDTIRFAPFSDYSKNLSLYKEQKNTQNLVKKIALLNDNGTIVTIGNQVQVEDLPPGQYRILSFAGESEASLNSLLSTRLENIYQTSSTGILVGKNIAVFTLLQSCLQNYPVGDNISGIVKVVTRGNITATSKLNYHTDAMFISEKSIELNPGFETNWFSVLEAKIEDCIND